MGLPFSKIIQNGQEYDVKAVPNFKTLASIEYDSDNPTTIKDAFLALLGTYSQLTEDERRRCHVEYFQVSSGNAITKYDIISLAANELSCIGFSVSSSQLTIHAYGSSRCYQMQLKTDNTINYRDMDAQNLASNQGYKLVIED